MNIPAFRMTPDGFEDTASGLEHYSPHDRHYSLLALGQIKANAQAAYEAAARILDMQTNKLPWEARSRKFEEGRLNDAVRAMSDVQQERVEKGYTQ